MGNYIKWVHLQAKGWQDRDISFERAILMQRTALCPRQSPTAFQFKKKLLSLILTTNIIQKPAIYLLLSSGHYTIIVFFYLYISKFFMLLIVTFLVNIFLLFLKRSWTAVLQTTAHSYTISINAIVGFPQKSWYLFFK